MDALPIKPTRHDVYDFISPNAGTKDAAVGKSVLVTGAGSGFGESKASIEAESPKCRVLCVPTDITDPEAVANLFQRAGKIDILVNNAGFTGDINLLAKTDFQKWWMAFVQINVRGTYMVTCEFLKLLKGGPGFVLNVSSRSSYVTAEGMSAYRVSKPAMNRLAEFIDKDYASQGVVAIAFYPGGVPGTKVADAAPEWLRKNFKDTPALPAATALYLTLPRAKYLSGRFINAQWDMEELESHRERIVSEDLLKMRVLGIDDHL
ncbi:Uu.00g127320.m01.CDS01 [Anthostomella pinea]|uniref:Uu.00g127320.m01.CDS01 n=1 Tax=Anthostomella pinea TaxID=933095 RepID=A0AAI8YFG4_9PEZI|nr:Uu.00g127320.m01.CDS01 [Anthostomella pinea]